MKLLTIFVNSKNDLELFGKITTLSLVVLIVFSQVKGRNDIGDSIKINSIYNNQVGDFDRTHIPNRPPVIAKMISVLKPNFSNAKTAAVAKKIHLAFLKYKIEPQIVLAIIDTESDFAHDKVSSSGDLSIAQVNVEVWNKEFERMNMKLIDREKLVLDDPQYSLEVMAQILHVLKTRYEKKDRKWYARYHSKTKKHKDVYLSKLDIRLKLLKNSQILALQ